MTKMTKKIIFLFITLLYTSTQVMALQCAIDCSGPESKVVNQKAKKMAEDHSCCHGKKEDKKSKHNQSHKDGEGNCFHEIVGSQWSPNDHVKAALTTDKVLHLQQLPVINFIKKTEIVADFNYRPKIPEQAFLRFKSHLDLYILKDQFLI